MGDYDSTFSAFITAAESMNEHMREMKTALQNMQHAIVLADLTAAGDEESIIWQRLEWEYGQP